MKWKTITAVALGLAATTGCDLVDRLNNRGDDSSGDSTGSQQAPVNVPTAQPPANNGNNTGLQLPNIPGLPIPNIGLPNLNGGNNGNNANAPRQTDATPLAAGSIDATGAFTVPFMQAEARQILAQLVGSLAPAQQQRVASIPLNFIANPAEVNAAAGCTRSGSSFMVITQGILMLNAALAEAKAVDEVANSTLRDDYTRGMIERVRRQMPVAGLAPGSVPANLAMNPQKLARQRFLFDAATAFILGHELAHHYRGHTGCANVGRAQDQAAEAEDMHRAVSRLAPLFNQPGEMEADTWGIVDVLDAGARRPQGRWNDDGAALSLDFFSQLENLAGSSPLLLFVRSHPPSALRRPVVQLAASQWRNGQRPSANNNGLPLPIPIPIMLPQGN